MWYREAYLFGATLYTTTCHYASDVINTGGMQIYRAHSGDERNGMSRIQNSVSPTVQCRPTSTAAAARRLAAAEHGRPKLHELGLVEIAVLVSVEHLHQRDGARPIDAHHLADHRHYLVLTEHAVAVLVQLVETLRQVVVTAHTQIQTRVGRAG